MSKLNKRPKTARVVERAATKAQTPVGPLKTRQKPTTVTYEGAPAYEPKAKTALFTLAVTNMVGEQTFYESANDRDARFTGLVRKVAVKDPAWMLGFLRFLRGTANMRTASIVAAAEAVKARLDAEAKLGAEVRTQVQQVGVNRQLIDTACQRADEPGELLAYWLANHGRNVPKPVKRGLADAAKRLYTEYSLLKYDTASHGVRFGDVLDLTHPTPATPVQGALFAHALDRRHGRDSEGVDPRTLPMIWENRVMRNRAAEAKPVLDLFLDSDILKHAGMTWEDVFSLVGSKVDKRKLWEAMIPNMGIMALIRNLRNFDEAGVSDASAAHVIGRLTSPAQIEKSRQLPFRFYTAYTQAPSDRWKHALAVALDLSCANVPDLPGRTLVLIDTSASMTGKPISAKSKVTPAQAAAVLGIVLAKRCGADVYGWADGVFRHDLVKGQTAMQGVAAFLARTGEAGHGTELGQAIRRTFTGHDRVVILSDMQVMDSHSWYFRGALDSIPAKVPVYCWDLQGYGRTPISTGGARHQLAGFSNSAFQLMPLLEALADGEPDWSALFGTITVPEVEAARSTVPESYDSGGVWTVS